MKFFLTALLVLPLAMPLAAETSAPAETQTPAETCGDHSDSCMPAKPNIIEQIAQKNAEKEKASVKKNRKAKKGKKAVKRNKAKAEKTAADKTDKPAEETPETSK